MKPRPTHLAVVWTLVSGGLFPHAQTPAADPALTPFPPPTGTHVVGTCARLLTDPSRSNRFRVATNSSFLVTVWYPAQAESGSFTRAAFAPYCARPLAERGAYWGGLTNRVPALLSRARTHAPLAGSPTPFPVVLYSHGLGDKEGRAVRTENTEKAQQLASHGFVVVACDHTDTYGTVLPPDRLVLGGNVWSFDFLEDRVRDVAFLLDRLAQWNVDDPVFKGQLDLDRIGIMGWSWGGCTAAEACRREPRLKAAVLLDGYFRSVPTLLTSGLAKPVLAMTTTNGSPDNTTLFDHSHRDAYQLCIRGATHDTFTDCAWIVNASAASRQQALAMNACLLSFFNKHLRGTDDGLLNDPGSLHPDVISLRKK